MSLPFDVLERILQLSTPQTLAATSRVDRNIHCLSVHVLYYTLHITNSNIQFFDPDVNRNVVLMREARLIFADDSGGPSVLQMEEGLRPWLNLFDALIANGSLTNLEILHPPLDDYCRRYTMHYARQGVPERLERLISIPSLKKIATDTHVFGDDRFRHLMKGRAIKALKDISIEGDRALVFLAKHPSQPIPSPTLRRDRPILETFRVDESPEGLLCWKEIFGLFDLRSVKRFAFKQPEEYRDAVRDALMEASGTLEEITLWLIEDEFDEGILPNTSLQLLHTINLFLDKVSLAYSATRSFQVISPALSRLRLFIDVPEEPIPSFGSLGLELDNIEVFTCIDACRLKDLLSLTKNDPAVTGSVGFEAAWPFFFDDMEGWSDPLGENPRPSCPGFHRTSPSGR